VVAIKASPDLTNDCALVGSGQKILWPGPVSPKEFMNWPGQVTPEINFSEK
jgi:hypothetical protein